MFKGAILATNSHYRPHAMAKEVTAGGDVRRCIPTQQHQDPNHHDFPLRSIESGILKRRSVPVRKIPSKEVSCIRHCRFPVVVSAAFFTGKISRQHIRYPRSLGPLQKARENSFSLSHFSPPRSLPPPVALRASTTPTSSSGTATRRTPGSTRRPTASRRPSWQRSHPTT